VHDSKTFTLPDTQTIRDTLLTLGYTRVIDFAQSVHQFPEYIKHIPTNNTRNWLGYGKSKMINKKNLMQLDNYSTSPKALNYSIF